MTLSPVQFLTAAVVLVLASGAVATLTTLIITQYCDGRRVGLARERSLNKAALLAVFMCTIVVVLDAKLLMKVVDTEMTPICREPKTESTKPQEK